MSIRRVAAEAGVVRSGSARDERFDLLSGDGAGRGGPALTGQERDQERPVVV